MTFKYKNFSRELNFLNYGLKFTPWTKYLDHGLKNFYFMVTKMMKMVK